MQKLDSMLGFCETTECRRQVLLNYFGEPLPKPCRNCDTCLEPVATWDGTQAAQKALSCIYRTGQRFGSSYLVDVLLGKKSERIRRFGHDQVTTFGIGEELSADQWRSVYRQLVAAGFIRVDFEGHGALCLTEQSRPLLRGERTLRLRQDPDRKKSTGPGRKSAVELPSDPEALTLWEALRDYRRQLALEQDVPAYVIFGDATLREILTYRPRDRDELSRISGVGQAKLERFGDGFLKLLATHAAKHGRPSTVPRLPVARPAPVGAHARESGLTDTIRETLELFRSGQGVEAIAEQRGLKPSTVYTHLERCIEEGHVAVQDVVRLDHETVRAIEFAIERLPENALMSLKPIYEAFEGRYDYGLLRCVRAGMGISAGE
jgi:ATP-dependent DNA helicase RecQ